MFPNLSFVNLYDICVISIQRINRTKFNFLCFRQTQLWVFENWLSVFIVHRRIVSVCICSYECPVELCRWAHYSAELLYFVVKQRLSHSVWNWALTIFFQIRNVFEGFRFNENEIRKRNHHMLQFISKRIYNLQLTS